MLKKSSFFIGLAGLCMLVFTSADVQASTSGSRLDDSWRQLGRGASNIVFSPLEIFDSVYNVQKEEGETAAVTYGFLQGVSRTFARIGVGCFEVATFPMGRNPMIGPEFPARGGVLNTILEPEKRTRSVDPGYWRFRPGGI